MSKHGDPPARPLYDRIEEIRIRRGLTKVQVARAAGVNRQTFTNLATQPRPPMASTVAEIADALGINRDEALRLAGLLPTDHPPEDEQRPTVDELDDRVKELEREVQELRAELRKSRRNAS